MSDLNEFNREFFMHNLKSARQYDEIKRKKILVVVVRVVYLISLYIFKHFTLHHKREILLFLIIK